MIDKATYSFLYFFSRLLSLFPRKLILTIGSFFGLLLYMFLPVRKKVAKINLNIAFPNKNKNEINRIIKKTYQHYGLLMFEFIANHKSKITDDIFNMLLTLLSFIIRFIKYLFSSKYLNDLKILA